MSTDYSSLKSVGWGKDESRSLVALLCFAFPFFLDDV